MSVALSRDIGAYLTGRFGGHADVLANGAGDATEVTSGYIDRQGYESCKVFIAYTATLANGESLAIAANLQDAGDSSGTGVADYGTVLASTVQVTSSGGGVETGVVELDFDLTGAKRYIRLQFTPDLSASGVDVADVTGIVVLGGAEKQPSSVSAI